MSDHPAGRLSPDRFFDAEPSVRRVARALYEETAALPLICPHGHVDPAFLALNRPFPEPTALLIEPDHYIFRMLYSRGVPLEQLGIPARDGAAVEADPRRIWQLFAEHYYLFLGTPTGVRLGPWRMTSGKPCAANSACSECSAWCSHQLEAPPGGQPPASAGA